MTKRGTSGNQFTIWAHFVNKPWFEKFTLESWSVSLCKYNRASLPKGKTFACHVIVMIYFGLPITVTNPLLTMMNGVQIIYPRGFVMPCLLVVVVTLAENLRYPFAHVRRGCFTGNGPLTRYVKLRVAHAPGMPGTFFPPPTSKETAS